MLTHLFGKVLALVMMGMELKLLELLTTYYHYLMESASQSNSLIFKQNLP